MPKVHQQIARKNIYARGLRIPDEKTKSGERIDRSQPADEGDFILIPAGKIYYKWTFRYGGTHRSLTRPRPSQLTQSEFLSTVYDIGERLGDMTVEDLPEAEAGIEEIREELENLRDETQEKLDNMPYQLQEAPTGQLLQGRIESLEEMISELEGIEIPNREDYDNDDEGEEEYQSALEDLLGEIQDIQYQGE